MAYYWTLCFVFIFSISLLVPLTESSRCSKNYTFQGLKLNSPFPSEFYPSSNDPNDDMNQDCQVKLAIDFTTGFVNGSFTAKNQSFWPQNLLDILTIFSL